MIGKKIKALRMQKGYSLTKMAEETDISKSYLSYIERGIQQNPSIKVLSKISALLNVSLEELMSPPPQAPNILDDEWYDLFAEAIQTGVTKEDFRYYLSFIRFKKEFPRQKKK
ncbi:helix-turn-helix domain-containing protein [Peribacillus psychrosaccharolyticus]|uniref:Helix-turn-helix domain-containing protein n=1 Tax=Peribacillus psychrosaccharolyticus TaxID=1407 RepID=A0A974NJU2_PERPY|nr:helix-turn-helix domain-containing protein [Peribacillus psychrosaccharolyticus]MEC2055500.1 helix-turn-helix domain-containing protein [Peribacillus psychrosaccharolyticus]MED3743472.1 helix-turn-helix domain-containing protein [Peribacillus psychrosaccharolyticus]QQS99176.1 helix-turn-helix domain-containing protein [Peribacillus psychrosaccharolyticus]